jgi:hypothetical protein
MATDIQGWVEIYDEEDDLWDGIIYASTLMARDYHVFGILFGVRYEATILLSHRVVVSQKTSRLN